ncbi:MAG: molybdopterin-guanine dinucleotide biosynthesis protein B [Candidatus Methylomirabilia bacterium]
MTPVVSIVGRSNSGKTTLLEKLIPALIQRGYRVGTIKHHHHGDFEADQPGKDSWRHARAGALVTALVSSARVALFQRLDRPMTFPDLVGLFRDRVDIVLTEGFKTGPFPKVEIARRALGQEPLCSREDQLIALVTDGDWELGVPRFGLEDIEPLATFFEESVLAAQAGQKDNA